MKIMETKILGTVTKKALKEDVENAIYIHFRRSYPTPIIEKIRKLESVMEVPVVTMFAGALAACIGASVSLGGQASTGTHALIWGGTLLVASSIYSLIRSDRKINQLDKEGYEFYIVNGDLEAPKVYAYRCKETKYNESNPNRAVLERADDLAMDFVLCNKGNSAWLEATKTKPMLAIELKEDRIVESIEGPLQAKAGQMLCVGAGGEYWVQKAEAVAKKYNNAGQDDSQLSDKQKEEMKKGGYSIYTPKPDRKVLTMQMPEQFAAEASWGTLKGKAGDDLVMPIEDVHNTDPKDVWIVDKKLSEATYEKGQ